MKIDILTLFPNIFQGPFAESIVARAQKEGKVDIQIHNLRKWADNKYKNVDDAPYGGGAGMVMRVDVIDRAVQNFKARSQKHMIDEGDPEYSAVSRVQDDKVKVVLLDTKGEMYQQNKAGQLSKVEHLILICGHYEGVDHRVHEHIADEVICIGPYVLTGGEIPAMVVVDSVTRLIPGVINPKSLESESFLSNQGSEFRSQLESNLKSQISNFQTEYPQYTRPAEYKGWKVPEVLLSGNHKKIEKWRSSSS